eukprot:COSAG02_NODE_84_length_39615_cov_144.775256_1_plen_91_part_10
MSCKSVDESEIVPFVCMLCRCGRERGAARGQAHAPTYVAVRARARARARARVVLTVETALRHTVPTPCTQGAREGQSEVSADAVFTARRAH